MAKIDVSTIEGYESMSAEDKLNAVLGMDIPDSSELEKLKSQISSKNSEISEWKKKHNALLDEDQRKQIESEDTMKALQDELQSLRRDKSVSTYKAKLLENGFTSDEASKAAEKLADGNIDGFFDNLASFRSSMEKNIKAELMRNNPTPGSTGGTDVVMTREKYDKLSMSEKMQFMSDHREEYEAMKKGE